MKDIKLNEKERHMLLSLLKEKEAALRAKLEHYKLLDAYDNDAFPVGLENHIEHDLNEIVAIECKVSTHFQMAS